MTGNQSGAAAIHDEEVEDNEQREGGHAGAKVAAEQFEGSVADEGDDDDELQCGEGLVHLWYLGRLAGALPDWGEVSGIINGGHCCGQCVNCPGMVDFPRRDL